MVAITSSAKLVSLLQASPVLPQGPSRITNLPKEFAVNRSKFVLCILWLTFRAVLPAFTQSGTWTTTGSMANARSGQGAAVLQNGNVLVVGASPFRVSSARPRFTTPLSAPGLRPAV